jgi:hypothetical protein
MIYDKYRGKKIPVLNVLMCRLSRNPGALTSRTPQGHVGPFRGYFTFLPLVFNIPKFYFLPTEYIYILFVSQGKKKSKFSLHSPQPLAFITEKASVFCAVRPGSLKGLLFVLRWLTNGEVRHKLDFKVNRLRSSYCCYVQRLVFE